MPTAPSPAGNGGRDSEPQSPGEKAPEAGSTEPKTALDFAYDQVERFRGVADKVRQRADTSAKALGGLATTAVGAIGIAKVADIFPIHWDGWAVVAVLATLIGFALIVAVVAAFTARLWQVNSPIFTSSLASRIPELAPDERKRVETTYKDMAELNGVPSLRAYEARAHRLDRIADRSHPPRRNRLRAQAALIRAEVMATQNRAAADVIRRRAAKPLTGKKAWRSYVVAVVGFLAFALGADYLEAERSGRVAIAKECAAAQKAVVDQRLDTKLPDICGRPEKTSADARILLTEETLGAFKGPIEVHRTVSAGQAGERLRLVRYVDQPFVPGKPEGHWWAPWDKARKLRTVAKVRELFALPRRFQKKANMRLHASVPAGAVVTYVVGTTAPQCEEEEERDRQIRCAGGQVYEGGGKQYYFPDPDLPDQWITERRCTEQSEDQPSNWVPCER